MYKRPPLLKKGDKVGIVAPSRMVTEDQMARGFEVLNDRGLDVVRGKHLFERCGYFAGTDEQRRSDLQQMLDDPDIAAVFCARGGYGMTRIVDQLDLTGMLSRPKWLIGFSDITALHLSLDRAGVESVHGLMPAQYEYMGVEESLSSLWELLFKGCLKYELSSHSMNRAGEARGQLVGGNLSLVAESLGTPTEVQTAGKILFIEEIDEYLYKIDRMLMQLSRAGKLSSLKGLIVGDFSQMKDTQIPFGKTILELINGHFEGYDIPVVFGFPAGHEVRNLALPFGREVLLKVTNTSVQLSDGVG